MLTTLWLIGWIFSIGYFKLSFWHAVLALVIWPYHFGTYFKNKYENK
jgi:hypothetical protein